MKSKILVTLQFTLILLMILTINSKSDFFYLGIVILLIGIGIGFIAIKEHNGLDFNIRPDIPKNSSLITTGIYSYIRHPMYFSVIFSMLGILIAFFSRNELFIYICLVSIMLIKLNYEEGLWCCYTKEYNNYKQKTKKIIPFIF